VIRVYSVNNATFDRVILTVFGVMGYDFVKIGCEPAPLLLGFILGPLLEEYFRRALIMSHGDLSVFVRNPISGTIIAMAAVLLLIVVLPSIRKKREEAFQE
jgi:TctA family transporter